MAKRKYKRLHYEDRQTIEAMSKQGSSVRNELTGGNCYLPCICWQEQADEAAQWQQGDTVELLGRYQSRQYEKVLDAATGEREQRTAYEVSARLIRRKEEAGNESKSRNE